MKMKRLKKVSCFMTAVGVLVCSLTMTTDAKTLKNAFSGNCNERVEMVKGGYAILETSTAKTSGYDENRNYYLRAYIGGSSSSATGAVADSTRKDFNAKTDGKASVTYSYGTYEYEKTAKNNCKIAVTKYTSYAKYGYR